MTAFEPVAEFCVLCFHHPPCGPPGGVPVFADNGTVVHRVCHTDDHSCYQLWMFCGHRPDEEKLEARARDELSGWVRRVADWLPDGPARERWRDYPDGHTIECEVTHRTTVLVSLKEYLAKGGRLETWEDLMRMSTTTTDNA